jgi:hypothetical protein
MCNNSMNSTITVGKSTNYNNSIADHTGKRALVLLHSLFIHIIPNPTGISYLRSKNDNLIIA